MEDRRIRGNKVINYITHTNQMIQHGCSQIYTHTAEHVNTSAAFDLCVYEKILQEATAKAAFHICIFSGSKCPSYTNVHQRSRKTFSASLLIHSTLYKSCISHAHLQILSNAHTQTHCTHAQITQSWVYT